MINIKNLSLLLLAALSFYSCDDDDDSTPATKATFEVKIENVQMGKSFLNSGETGMIMPGESMTYTFNAGKGTYLSFATMFVESNDLFYAFDDTGLALYDDEGNATTGDVTAQVSLWDAGTEVNEEPGVGMNQPLRQSGPDTGMEENGTIILIGESGDGFTYPATNNVIRVSLEHDGGSMFTLTLDNVSNTSTLPSPLAPGAWAIHGAAAKLFEENQAASAGIEGIAEDGNNSTTVAELSANTGYTSPFAPGVWAVHDNTVNPIFDNNAADKGEGLEELSEDGLPSKLAMALASKAGVGQSGIINTPMGASEPGPLMGGQSYSFTFEAEEGDYLSFATMLIHTNDLFFAFGEQGIPLFANGTPNTGDFTAEVDLWDAGTEVNEYPGAGNAQPARGMGGVDENGNVRIVNDDFMYPATNQLMKITVSQK